MKTSFQRLPQIQKPPVGNDCFLLDRGGKETIIEPPGGGSSVVD